MQFLVTTDHFGGPPPSPEHLGPLLETVANSLDTLVRLQEERKILAGGVPAGQKRQVFIVEAASIDEVTELVHRLPFWMAHKWEITPLENWSQHANFLRSM